MATERTAPGGIAEAWMALDQVVEGVEDQLLVIDRQHRIRVANSAVRARLPKGSGDPIGRYCHEVLYDRDSPCSAPSSVCPLREVMQSGRGGVFVRSHRVQGTDRYYRVTAYPLRDEQGNPSGIVEIVRDDTTTRVLETQIVRRHHQIGALNRISTAVGELRDLDTILQIALDSVLEMVNGSIGGVLFVDEDTGTLTYRLYRGLSPGFVRNMRMGLGEGIAGRVVQTGEPILLDNISVDPRAARPDLLSTEGLKSFVSFPLKAKNEVVAVMNVASHAAGQFGADDMSLLTSIGEYVGTAIDQARLYDQLARANERYHSLLQYALNTQEEERKRIARELHDESSQALTSLTLSLQAAIQMAEMSGIDDPALLDRLQKAHTYAVHAGTEVVRLMKELRPSLLDELGLPAAINRYAKDTLEGGGIRTSTTFKGTDERLSPEVEVTLFRIAQGAIGNILKHSSAMNSFIDLECGNGECVLEIRDDGQGFDVTELRDRDSRVGGAGIFTMEERAKLMGGTFLIESRSGQGTRVKVTMPAMAADQVNEEDQGPDR